MATGSLDPEELEFLAEDTMVTIIPSVKYPVLYMLTGDIGPMEPSIPVEVPLWLAVHMRQRKQCRLVLPDWLSVEALAEQKDREFKSKVFEAVPSESYVEISQLIVEHFAEEIPESNNIRLLIKDILDQRLAKLRTSVDAFMKRSDPMGKVDHITQIELCSLRNLLTCGMDQLEMLRSAGFLRVPSSTQSFSESGNVSSSLNVTTSNSTSKNIP
jgi:GINS complex subunit 2